MFKRRTSIWKTPLPRIHQHPFCLVLQSRRHRRSQITRGSVWFADLAPRSTSNLIPTSVQTGTRPVLVISNDLNNRYGTVITYPFTGAPKRLDMPTHVAVAPADVRNGYQPSEIYESTLLAEQVTVLDKARLVSYVGMVVSQDLMSRVETALLTQVGISLS